MIRRLTWLAAFTLMPLCGQDTEQEPKPEKEPKEAAQGIRFVWRRHPSIRFGDWLRIDFRTRLQMDWQVYDPEVKATPDLFRFARRRFGIEGTVVRDFEYEVSYETAETDFHWKDIYGNWRRYRSFQVRGGPLPDSVQPRSADGTDATRVHRALPDCRPSGAESRYGRHAARSFRRTRT